MRRILKENSGFIASPHGKISYLLIRTSRKKTMEIRINRHAQVHVIAPHRAPTREIHRFIQKKTPWIVQKVEEVKKEIIKSLTITNEEFKAYISKNYYLANKFTYDYYLDGIKNILKND